MSALLDAITELETRRREIDDAITVLRRLLPPSRPNGVKPPTAAKPRAPSTQGGRKIDPKQNAEVRRLYEAGTALDDIERRTGVKKATIYYRASAGQWKRPKEPAGEALAGKVHCPACGEWTERDPCTSCGKAVRP